LLTHFEEKRGDDFSVDRLGKSSLDRKVIAYLKPRADAAGKLFSKPKSFGGWAVLHAREIKKDRARPGLQIVASPVNDPEPNDNVYHAHIDRPADMEAAFFALHLRHLFTTYGKVEPVAPASVSEPWWRRFVDPVLKLFGL